MQQKSNNVTVGGKSGCVFGLLFWSAIVVAAGCGRSDGIRDTTNADVSTSKATSLAGDVAPSDHDSIRRFCGDCHAVPLATSFDKERWDHEVKQGIRLYRESGRTDLVVPDFDATLAFFRDQAPETISIPIPDRTMDTRFKPMMLGLAATDRPVAVSQIRWLPPDSESSGGLESEQAFLMADIWTGRIDRVELHSDSSAAIGCRPQTRMLASVAHPSHVEPVEMNGDGIIDYVVADLGTLSPQSERQGSVWLLKGKPDGSADRMALRLGLSRVAEVRPIDHDADGDFDLLVGDFGLHFEGGTYLVENQSTPSTVTRKERPKWDWNVIDSRPGVVELEVVDFNGDGRMDYVAVVSQHYESIEVGINLGDGRFEQQVIFQGGDPSLGSSGMELIDFDHDGDLDVICTHGDTFDDSLAKPFHGITYLENEGTYPFTPRRVADMPGCYCAVAGDLDGDGDNDIAAVSLLSDDEVARYPAGTFDAIAWFEQTSTNQFRRHSIRVNRCQAATCSVVDIDDDGDLDLVVPPYDTDVQDAADVEIFLNTASGRGEASS